MRYVLKYIISFFIIISLTGCETMDGFMRDLDSFEEEDTNPVIAQDAPVYVLPKISEKPMPPVSIKPKTTPKPTNIIPKIEDIRPKCTPDIFIKAKTISDLYTAYYKNPKECPSLEYYSLSDNITKIIVSSLRMQDVRLLNADVAFATFMFNIIKQSDFDLKKTSREMIAQKGCGLLGKMRCMALEAALIEFDN